MKILLEVADSHAEELAVPAEREFSIEPAGDGFAISIDGMETTVVGSVGSVTRALVGGRPVEASVHREGDLVVVEWHGRRYAYRVRDARAPRLARRRQADAARGEIHAPMPGLVVEILAELGERVEAGRPLLVVEAMKMQNALPAPLSGRVTAIAVTAGTPVESGALLLTITPEEE
jgi:3-methylcrotonyl-CoA carboxylase alpha subunit